MDIRLKLILFAASVPLIHAQEYRATVSGNVSDPGGASVPAARVTAINNQTTVAASAVTSPNGAFQIPFLPPGVYTLRVEHDGFKTMERSPLELHVNDNVRIDVELKVGQLAEHVTVMAEAPLLEVNTGGRGQVVGNDKITDLPLDGHNPFTLMNLAAGAQYVGSMLYSRPFDNGAIADFSINGGRDGINEYQIDGVSNNANTGRSNLAYAPPAEATQEFKIQTNIYDAQYGRTGGGVINVSIKPGTNRFHGAAYEYMRRTVFEANQFASNAAGQPRTDRHVDQYGFEIDGPVSIPRVYRGKDRTFFMFSLEKYNESTPQPALGAVPTQEQRNGDFSKTFTSSKDLYTIYDPLTSRANPDYDSKRAISVGNLQNMRLPFAGNQVPKGRMEPIALRVLQDIPLPNQDGDPVTHLNNWFGAKVAEDTDFHNLIARVDHALNNSWKMFGRWNHNLRDGGVIDYWGWATPATRKIHAGRQNDGAVIDVLGTLSPRTIFTARLGFNRFKQFSTYSPTDISSLGLPKAFVNQLQMPDAYPQFTFENYLQTGINQWDIIPSETYSAQTGVTRITGGHTLKLGFEMRMMHYANLARANASGTFGFTRGWTSITSDLNDPRSGNAMASFLLGNMNAASATLNATPYISWRYPVVFVQEDWQVSRRLTLNFGLRWDYEAPPTERFNAQNRGFDFTSRNPIQAPGLDVRGGLLYAGVDGQPRGAFNPDYKDIQPRFGFAYKMLRSKPLVFRGGVGRAFLPTVDFGGSTGFSQTTNAEVSTVENRAFRLLSNPFPSGLIPRPGASRGLATQVGDAIAFNDPSRVIPYVWQYSAGFQYELRPGILIEATYAGSQTAKIQASKNINVVSAENLAQGTAYLNQGFDNPFYGVLPTFTARGSQARVQRRVLIVPYPQFGAITESQLSLGRSWYNSLQLKIEQRFKHGLSYLVTYTNSKNMEAYQFRNAQDARASRELVASDAPQRLVVSGVWQLPIGPKKKWLVSGPLSKAVGNWQLSWSGVTQSGTPIAYPDYYMYGNPALEHPTLEKWFDTSKSIWIQRPPDTLRVEPFRSPNIRRNTAPQFNVNLLRTFRIGERQRVQLRMSAFNVTNTPIFGAPVTDPASPLFGVVKITQINLPRSVELGFRYSF